MTEDELSRSGVLKAEFGPNWRRWQWLRKQFTTTSVSVIGVIIGAGWGYIAHLRESVAKVTERVVVLETRVVPVITNENQVAAIQQAVEDHDRRLTRLEDNYDTAQREAGRPPSRRSRGR